MSDLAVPRPAAARQAGPARFAALSRLLHLPRASFGVAVIALVLFCAAAAPLIAPFDPEDMDFDNLLSGPSALHLLGTDQLGHDTLTRLIFGSRVALAVSVLSVGLGVLTGAPLGLVSVYFRGWVDDVLMRFMDALTVFPGVLVAVALAATLGGSLWSVVLAIGIANVPWMARIVRSQGLWVREQDYVVAAQACGAGHWRVISRHLLPNTLAPVIVQATLGMGYAVLTEAALGFIGVGVQPPTPTWGNMLQQAFPVLDKLPILSIVPGFAIFALVLAFNFIGDALRDVLDPRLLGIVR